MQGMLRHVVCCGLCRYVGVDDSQAVSTAGGLEQGYCLCPAEVRCTPIAATYVGSHGTVASDFCCQMRFLLLFTFLKKNKNKKVIVFFAACNSVNPPWPPSSWYS